MLRSSRVPGARRRGLRGAGNPGMPAQCGGGRHVLQMPGLRLQTPAAQDFPMMMAAASDPQAQRWLGWRPQDVVPECPLTRSLGWIESEHSGPMPGVGISFRSALDFVLEHCMTSGLGI